MQRTDDHGVLSPNEYIYTMTHVPKVKEHGGREGGTTVKTWGRGGTGTVSPRYDKEAISTIPQ